MGTTLAVALLLVAMTMGAPALAQVRELPPPGHTSDGTPPTGELVPPGKGQVYGRSELEPSCAFEPHMVTQGHGSSFRGEMVARSLAQDDALARCLKAKGARLVGSCPSVHSRCVAVVDQFGTPIVSGWMPIHYEGNFQCTARCEQ